MKNMAIRAFTLFLIFALVAPMFAQSNQHNDDRIYDEVRRRLANDPDVKGAGFDVAVKDGAVTINGTVHDQKAREKAERLAKKVKGVTSVVNQLKVDGM
jgi:hyperosmotically inducible protein